MQDPIFFLFYKVYQLASRKRRHQELMPKPFPMTRRGYLLVQQHPPRTSPVRWRRCRLLLSYCTLLYRGPPIEQLPDFFFWSTANQRAEDTACLVNCSFCVSSLLFLWDFVGFGRDKYTYARDTPFMCFSSSFPFGLHQIEEHDSASKFKAPTRILASSSFLVFKLLPGLHLFYL